MASNILSVATAAALVALSSAAFAQTPSSSTVTAPGINAAGGSARCEAMSGLERARCLREEENASSGASASESTSSGASGSSASGSSDPSTGSRAAGGMSSAPPESTLPSTSGSAAPDATPPVGGAGTAGTTSGNR